MDGPVIRPATEADLGKISDIYNYYVLNSTCTYQVKPETQDERIAWFQARGPEHPVIVAEANGEVIGWASLSSYKSRCAYAHTVESSVYLRFDMHRRGLGRTMMQDLIARAKGLGHHCILAGASGDQTASIALHESLGFTKVAHFREVGHKFGRWLDVVYFQLML